MKSVVFTLEKENGSTIDLTYQPFDNPHSKIWYDSIQAFIDSGVEIEDCDRVYNLIDYQKQIALEVDKCNDIIKKLNHLENISIPLVGIDNFQEDINFVHTFFVDSPRTINHELWNGLNLYLHGIEILERSKKKYLQGQVFVGFPNSELKDIPQDSYRYFTVKKTFGYCYANYPHVGRHILEMFLSKDEHAHDDHVLPMHKISANSYLWLGSTNHWLAVFKKRIQLKSWFIKNKIDQIVDMPWGDPKLAIGWLPVAKLVTKIDRQNLIGCVKLIKVSGT